MNVNVSNVPAKIHICHQCQHIEIYEKEIDHVKCRKCGSDDTSPVDISSYNMIMLSVIAETIKKYVNRVHRDADDPILIKNMRKKLYSILSVFGSIDDVNINIEIPKPNSIWKKIIFYTKVTLKKNVVKSFRVTVDTKFVTVNYNVTMVSNKWSIDVIVNDKENV